MLVFKIGFEIWNFNLEGLWYIIEHVICCNEIACFFATTSNYVNAPFGREVQSFGFSISIEINLYLFDFHLSYKILIFTVLIFIDESSNIISFACKNFRPVQKFELCQECPEICYSVVFSKLAFARTAIILYCFSWTSL